MNPKEYAKAIIACIIAGTGVLIAGAASDGLSLVEALSAIPIAATAFGATWGIPNKQPTEAEKAGEE